MQSPVHLLMKQLMGIQESQNFEINPQDKDTIYSTLNAQFLSKLINDKLIKYVKDLDKIFNDLALRNEIKDESEIQWIHKKASQLNPNMNIALPEFKFNDLFYLFVGYSGDITNVNKGPLMSNINCSNLLNNLSKILFVDYDKFIDCADKIAYSIFRIVFEDSTEKEVPKNHSDYKIQFEDELKKSKARKNVGISFKNEENNGKSSDSNEENASKSSKNDKYQTKLRNESLMSAAICILEVSDNSSLISSPYKFLHDDKTFLNPNWIKDSEFISKYPSFVYWLVKYQKYVVTLQNFYSNSKFKDKNLPFWLFSLRIMSSQNCIILDIDSSTMISKIITETINKYIKSYISSKGMRSLGTDWLSLVLSSVPSEILVPNYRMFYDFFTYLSKDDKKNSELVDKQKKESIIEFTENVCEMIFNKNANGLLEKHFGDLSDSNLAFIHDPNGFINNKIKAFVKQQFVDFHLSEDFKTIQMNSSKIEHLLISKISRLRELINKENKEKEVRFVQSQREKQINKLSQLKKDMKKNIDKYNENIIYLKNEKPKYMSAISRIGVELSQLQDSLSELTKTTEDPLILYKLDWNEHISLRITISKKKFIDIYFYEKSNFYFTESAKEKAKIKTLMKGKQYDQYEWKEIKFYLIDEGSNNLDEICAQKINFYQLNARIPTLIFGSKTTMQHDEFVQKLYSINNIFSSFVNEIEQNIMNETITETAFSRPKKLISEFSSISPLLTVRFTDDDECQSVQNLLNELKQFYSQLERYAYNFDGLLRNKIYYLWKSYSNMSYASKLFTFQYQLPFPSHEKVETAGYNISFDSVAGADFLSLPILSVEKNEENMDCIACCFDSLDCSIGPIIPSLYSGKCAMNFISFIDSPISIEIKTDSYQELFSSRNLIKPDEPCQIFIELPSNPTKEIKNILIETTLIIEAPDSNLVKLELPCNFNFKLVPLAILISCKEFPLSFSDDAFYLCALKILPDSKLSFSFLNIYVNEPSKIAYQLIDFEDNEADKPDVKYSNADDELRLYIKDVENVTKLHCTLKVKFSESLIANVLIDTVIVPFEFGFDLYDYNKKQYVNDNSTIYYSSQFLDRKIKLHCRLYGMFLSQVNASIKNNFSYPVSTVSSPANLAIQEDTEFDIVIYLKDKISNTSSSYHNNNSYYHGSSYYSNSYYNSSYYGGSNYSGYRNTTTYYSSSYYVSVKIGGIEKKVFLKFEEPNIISQYGNYFNSSYFDIPFVFGFDWKDKKWKLLNSNNYYSSDLVYIVSPFHKFDKFSIQNSTNYHISVPRVKCIINFANTFKVSSTKTLEITNAINNTFYSLNDKGECNFVNFNKLEFKLIFAPNKTIFGVADKEWYPVFDEYDEYFESFTQLEMIDENIEYAKGKLSNIPDPTFISQMNFIVFTRLLCGNIVVLKNLYKLINKLPPSFNENEFNEVLNYLISILPTLNENDKFIPIIQYNLIYIFYNLFKKRYQEIQKSDGYLFNKLNESEIKDKINEFYNLYIQIDDLAKSKDSFNESQKKLKKIKKKLSNITFHLQPPNDEQYEAYLITDDSKPKPNPKDDLPEQIAHSTSQNTFSTDKTININLPPIDIPSKSQYKELSIQSLNKFYQTCTEGTRLLPIYVKNMLIQDSIEMKKKAKEYFLKLLQIYKPLPTKDYSFVSIAVNTFSLSFASMVNKFEKAGVNFHSLVPKKFILNEQNIQGLIQYPEKDQFILSQDIWSFKAFQSNESNTEQVLHSGTSTSRPQQNYKIDPYINPDLTPEPEPNAPNKPDPNLPNTPDKPNPVEAAYIKRLEDEYNKCKEEEDIEIGRSDDDDDDDGPITSTIRAASPNDGEEEDQATVDPENFDGLLAEFTEKDGIERAILRMKNINPENPLSIEDYTYHDFKPSYLNPDTNVSMENYPIISLMNQSFVISQEFIRIASDLDLPCSTLCVNILIDCSTFISDENKIFNMLIICALTDAITTLGVPYSAAVIGDKNFKCIIKPFDESHSYIALQRICDCLLIKRYRPKLPGCIQYAIDKMEFPNNERKNRAIFTFTNGLDEQLVLTKGWAEIFKYPQISFGFIFIKSSELIGDNLAFLENVWDKFEKETNGKVSSVKIVKIIADRNLQKPNGEMSDMVKSIVELFATIMKRTLKVDENHLAIDRNYKQPLFEIPDEMKLKSLKSFENSMSMKYGHLKNIFVQRSDVLKNATSVIDQLDTKQFNNNLNKITSCNIDDSLKKSFPLFLKEFIQNSKNISRASLETIFKPNKASQTILSSTGTDFDITALIFNLINPVPDPLIYLEEKGGLIRNYGVTVVIDASYSCFNSLSYPHSLQTIRSILSSLAAIDLPCFDLVIATNSSPIVLCSEVKTLYSLNERSPIWDSLFSILQNIKPKYVHNDLASAIHTAFDLRRIRTLQCTGIMFVLTDGLYNASERPRIIECINNCVQSGMITFGIGMGIYPKGIEKIFPQFVFTGNPSNVMKGVSNLFSDNFFDYSESMFCISSSFNADEITKSFKCIIDNIENPTFKALCDDLNHIMPTLDAFSDFINQEQDIGNSSKGFINPEGKDTELYIKDFLKSQKILIVHLCDDTVCSDQQLNKKYIFENYIQDRKECINEAVKFFGITLNVVQNYEDAILEITKSTNDCCEYYAVWVICGKLPEQLPTGQRNTNKYIVEQFIEVLIKFWKNGGSLVFWADNDPFTFQVNLFLRRVRFEKEDNCPSGSVNIQIHGNHRGRKILLGDDTGKLKQEQVFNRSRQVFDELERTTISHNLAKIYEGSTLSFVENINAKTDGNYMDKIKPFKPFAIDSDGGITSLFYPSNLKTGTGDIVIDCGFSKLFYELKEEGTFRYIQNIAGWTARPEVHLRMNRVSADKNKGKNAKRFRKPCDWRPAAVSHTISNISSPNYGSDVNDLISRASRSNVTSVIKENVRKLGGNINGVLRFSIRWNDIGDWDNNDLDAHCKEPTGNEIYYSNKVNRSTGGNLDIDITSPKRGEPACENITWPDLYRMANGTYRFFVHQYAYRNGHSGFRAEIEFENQIFSYDYRNTLNQGVDVDVAYVTLQNGRFSISHRLPASY